MTIAAVSGQAGGNNGNSATSVTRAFGSNVSAGSLIVVVGMKYSPSSDAFVEGDCTKSAGTATLGTITLDRQVQVDTTDADFACVAIWSAIVTGGGSLTMQVAGAVSGSYLLIATHEFTGNWDGSRAEAGNSNSTASNGVSPATSGNATSAGAALFIGGLNVNSQAGVTITPDGAFTTIYEDEAGTDDNGSAIYKIVTSGNTDQAEWTIASGTWYGWAAAVQVYKEAAVAPGGWGALLSQSRNRLVQ